MNIPPTGTTHGAYLDALMRGRFQSTSTEDMRRISDVTAQLDYTHSVDAYNVRTFGA